MTTDPFPTCSLAAVRAVDSAATKGAEDHERKMRQAKRLRPLPRTWAPSRLATISDCIGDHEEDQYAQFH